MTRASGRGSEIPSGGTNGEGRFQHAAGDVPSWPLSGVRADDLARFVRVLHSRLGRRSVSAGQVSVAYCVVVLDMTLQEAAEASGDYSRESAGVQLSRVARRCGMSGAREFRRVMVRDYWRAVGREEAA